MASALRVSTRQLLRRAAAPRAPFAAVSGVRHFAASPLEATSKLYEDIVAKSVKEFKANEAAVSSNLDAEIASNKIVLFMEGSVDAPKSETSYNVVKMLTQVQAVPMVSVDVLSHPAILGYTVSKTSRSRGPHLYVNGSFYADHDGILSKFNTGDLAKELGTASTMSSGVFGGELPIATY
eukprot:CAMPEP_0206555338 /NCGR_PEP_ID=MMETSP0325_2-20121206/17726_1 /ASSEMBLY_ACC=CAM_ASM_000347 /TAXON_ID=2866 /ORGANISM="Crypthecodinium cohnii, Strain Seligo" /LENGTH=179 /DNA_ID=CAMNT_0054055603 /DNA_START=67 /DNA_END=606 /DNA_ORIENTATION=+